MHLCLQTFDFFIGQLLIADFPGAFATAARELQVGEIAVRPGAFELED